MTASRAKKLRRWSTGGDDAPGSAVTALAARDGALISGHADGTLSAWDTSTGMRRWSSQLDSEVTSLAIDDTGAAVAATEAAGSVGVWQGSNGAAIQQLAPEAAAARAVAFHPARPLLAAGGDDGNIALWDARQGTAEASFGDATRPIRALAFNAAGTLLAAAEAGGSVGIWDLASQTRQTTLSGLRFDADDVVFGPDGTVDCGRGRHGASPRVGRGYGRGAPGLAGPCRRRESRIAGGHRRRRVSRVCRAAPGRGAVEPA